MHNSLRAYGTACAISSLLVFWFALDADAQEVDWVPRFYCGIGGGGGGLSARGEISGEIGLEGGITEFIGWSGGIGWVYSQKTEWTPDTSDNYVSSYVEYGTFDDGGIALFCQGSIILGEVSLGVVLGWGQRAENRVVRGTVPPTYLYLQETSFRDCLLIGATVRLRLPWGRGRIYFELSGDTFRGLGIGIGMRY